MAFRTAFATDVVINWYPGHMVKATKAIIEKLKAVDMIIEVRDARIPFSSANPRLEEVIHQKSRLIVFNKTDLANHNLQTRVQASFEKNSIPVLFTNANTGRGLSQLLPAAIRVARERQRAGSVHLMIVGYPNVGKSSIINALLRADRQKAAAVTGPQPGVTRTVQAIKLNSIPPVYLLDTPGVMVPRVENIETGLRLALTGAIKDERVGEQLLADFLLFTLNRVRSFEYVKSLQLPAPTDNIASVLEHVRMRLGAGKTSQDAARHLLRLYRSGALGAATLDDIP